MHGNLVRKQKVLPQYVLRKQNNIDGRNIVNMCSENVYLKCKHAEHVTK